MSAPPIEFEPSNHGRVVALTGGTLAVALVAALVITFTPRQAATTTAIAATTVPAQSAMRTAADTAIAAAESIRSTHLAAATAIPSAIADIPAAAFRSTAGTDVETATRAVLPDLDDRVTVLTEVYAYSVAWRDVARLDLAGDAVVIDDDGIVVAHLRDGRFIVSHDLLVDAVID